MAAPTTVQKGLDYLLKVGDSPTTIGGGTNATLNINNELIDTTNKGSSGWRTALKGMRSWSMDFDGMYLETNELAGSTMNFTVGGVALKGMKNISFDISTDLIDSVNSTAGLDRDICPATKSMSVTVSGEWYDVDLDTTSTGGDEALEAIIDELMSTTDTGLTCILSFGANQAFTFGSTAMKPSGFTLSTPHDGIMEYSVTLETDGNMSSIDTQAGINTGLGLFLDAILDGTIIAVELSNQATYTEWTGTAYAESMNVSIEYTGTVSVSGSLAGHGGLTMAAT